MRPRGFALVLVPVYLIKHSISCYIYYVPVVSLYSTCFLILTIAGNSYRMAAVVACTTVLCSTFCETG